MRGWDPDTKEPIVATATPADLPGGGGNGSSGPSAAAANFPNKQEIVVDSPVTSAEERTTWRSACCASAPTSSSRARRKSSASPTSGPATTCELSGLGTRFTNDYYVKKVEHTLGSAGYTTNFEVRSTYDGGLAT